MASFRLRAYRVESLIVVPYSDSYVTKAALPDPETPLFLDDVISP